jgi:[ribosomal protein S18]-alanine N-acetyltransferase
MRLDAWPSDPSVGHLIVLEHDAVPSSDELAGWIERARRRDFRVLRTGALFPDAAFAVLEAGFRSLDSLVLLRIDLDDPAALDTPRPTGVRVTRLWARHHPAAAEVDRISFGATWGNDVRSLADIRRATPAHWARRVGSGRRVDAFAISGAGGRTGYVQRLAVHPDHRRSGIANALVHDALVWMRARGLSSALVNTGEGNAPALALYERWGFRRLGDRLTVAEFDLTGSHP